ncbi:P-loop containing nucleoside triphosphate hydrolase protein [Trametes elegans]|nr:P-loop containing nucleoside triphosphate hydrolase protein [Trametes elegans]
MRDAYGWDEHPKAFQLAGVKAQLEGMDLVIQASTGAGKTAIAAGPHLWPSSKGKTTIMVCPLLSLEDEMVRTFDLDFGLRAVAVNSKNGACSPLVIKKILAGTYQIVLISPEMLQSRTFLNRVLRNHHFARRVLSVVVDEAHCISHWGADFRKKYGSLGVVRAFLPRGTSVVALSATLTPRVRRDIMSKLQFPKNPGGSFLNVGNDRPNVSIIVCACEHPLNSYADLDFVIPETVSSPELIPKSYVYADNIHTGTEIVDYIQLLIVTRTGIPKHEAEQAVRPFNAVMSDSYRLESMDAFRRGKIRILVCTDAAGMGCNVRDVDLVVQWRLPSTLSNFIQRAGRAARDPSRSGIAVLLVERSAFSPPGHKAARNPQPSHHSTIHHTPASTQAARADSSTTISITGELLDASKPRTKHRRILQEYAEAHGSKRGSCAANQDARPLGAQPALDPDAADEGLISFVQSVQCRREVWSAMYESPLQDTSVGSCCDLCEPALLDQVRPGKSPRTDRVAKVKRGKPVAEYQHRLDRWCEDVYQRDHSGAQWDSTGILNRAQIEHLTAIGPVDYAKLSAVLQTSWVWWDEYAGEFLNLMRGWPIPFLPLSRKGKTAAANPSKKRATYDNPSDDITLHCAKKRVRPAVPGELLCWLSTFLRVGPILTPCCTGSSSEHSQITQDLHWEEPATQATYAGDDMRLPPSIDYPRISWESENQLTIQSYPPRREHAQLPASPRQVFLEGGST